MYQNQNQNQGAGFNAQQGGAQQQQAQQNGSRGNRTVVPEAKGALN